MTEEEGQQMLLEQEEMQWMATFVASKELDKIGKAMAKAQAAMGHAAKNAVNGGFNSNYADLASCIDAWSPALSENGLSLVQMPYEDNGKVGLCTVILHESGQYLGSKASMAPQKAGPHGWGSALTYLRRYCGSAITGLSQADDDGNTAQGQKTYEDKGVNTSQAWKKLNAAAKSGTVALKEAWEKLSVEERTTIGNTEAEKWSKVKSTAADVDAAAEE